VEGQVIAPPSAALLNSADLLSTLNLTDYSPGDTDLFSLSDDDEDEDSDEDTDEDTKSDIAKKLAAASTTPSAKPTENSTSSPTTSAPSEQPTTNAPPPEPVEGSNHKAWSERKKKYDDCRSNALPAAVALCPLAGPEPSFTS
jgi:hypothetical protein